MFRNIILVVAASFFCSIAGTAAAPSLPEVKPNDSSVDLTCTPAAPATNCLLVCGQNQWLIAAKVNLSITTAASEHIPYRYTVRASFIENGKVQPARHWKVLDPHGCALSDF